MNSIQINVTNGLATLNLDTSELEMGNYDIIAQYQGNSNYADSSTIGQLVIGDESTDTRNKVLSGSTIPVVPEYAIMFKATYANDITAKNYDSNFSVTKNNTAISCNNLIINSSTNKTSNIQLNGVIFGNFSINDTISIRFYGDEDLAPFKVVGVVSGLGAGRIGLTNIVVTRN